MFYSSLKRLVDITSALFLLILFLPVWLIVPILIKLDSQGPVFFTQKRVGLKGKIFSILKFRTMKMYQLNGQTVHGDDFWKKDKVLYEKYKKSGWKLTLDEDPRVTRMGRVLRQTSIDEFPQLFNILRGDMSLIGPRPLRKIEIKDAISRYGSKIKHLIDQSLEVKPGLTGPWQVAGRNDVPWDKRVELDADYAKRHSLVYDLTIAFKTPLAMISKW
ncbi:sugar transferase [Candidatus Collierbacteria bacterium]|nr:sugar transferase [Candidatus Collierbacteria bacterium]